MMRKRSAWQFCGEIYMKQIAGSGRLVNDAALKAQA
jgi:hypothetical protein